MNKNLLYAYAWLVVGITSATLGVITLNIAFALISGFSAGSILKHLLGAIKDNLDE